MNADDANWRDRALAAEAQLDPMRTERDQLLADKAAAALAWMVLANHLTPGAKLHLGNCIATLTEFFRRPT